MLLWPSKEWRADWVLRCVRWLIVAFAVSSAVRKNFFIFIRCGFTCCRTCQLTIFSFAKCIWKNVFTAIRFLIALGDERALDRQLNVSSVAKRVTRVTKQVLCECVCSLDNNFARRHNEIVKNVQFKFKTKSLAATNMWLIWHSMCVALEIDFNLFADVSPTYWWFGCRELNCKYLKRKHFSVLFAGRSRMTLTIAKNNNWKIYFW